MPPATRPFFLPDQDAALTVEMTSYDEMAFAASGHSPYPWQTRVAEQGLPELISVETGAGKTAGVVLPWLYRRRFHAAHEVRLSLIHISEPTRPYSISY